MEGWLSGLKRLIANPLYTSRVPRVRIPLSPFTFYTYGFIIRDQTTVRMDLYILVYSFYL